MEPVPLARRHDLATHRRFYGARELGDVESRLAQVVVIAHAYLAEPERLQARLEATDLREPLGGHRSAVRDATREARRRGLVPYR